MKSVKFRAWSKLGLCFVRIIITVIKTNITWLILYIDSSEKCHNFVSFQPIFNFKKSIILKAKKNWRKALNFKVVVDFLYTVFTDFI